jgi:hypothetical protein
MISISLRGRVRPDGTLELRVPTELAETDVEVMLVLQPVAPREAESKGTTWPEGYFDDTFGCLRDNPITYDPPPDLDVRLELN